MTEELTSRMAVLVEFLGAVLGQDYEVALYDLDTEGYPVVAIANGRISGQTIGSPLPEAAREKLRQEEYGRSGYAVNFTSHLQGNRKEIRSSVLLIRDEEGIPRSMLGINFDDSRFLTLSHRMMELVHPRGYLRQRQPQPLPGGEERERGEAVHNDVMEMVEEIFSSTAATLLAPPDRLTQEELIQFVAVLRDRGLFRLKGGIQYAAEKLGCSQASVYRYLDKAKQVGRAGES